MVVKWRRRLGRVFGGEWNDGSGDGGGVDWDGWEGRFCGGGRGFIEGGSKALDIDIRHNMKTG